MTGDEPERDPLSPGRTSPRVLALSSALFVLPLFVFTSIFAQALHPGFGFWFVNAFVFVGAAFVLVRLSGRSPWPWTGTLPFRPGQAAFGFALGLANFLALVVPLQFAAQLIFPPDLVEQMDSARIFRDRSQVELVLLVGAVTLAAPFAEEFFFRGVLQNALHEARVRAVAAMLGVSLLFSALHFDPVGFTARTELGLLFGYLFWRTGSLWPAVFAHLANNLVSTVIFFVSQNAAPVEKTQTEGVMEIVTAAGIGWAFAGALIFAARRFPSLLARAEHPERQVAAPHARMYPTVAPWLVAALLSIALVGALEHRTIALNWFDIGHPLPTSVPEQTRDELTALRNRARTGEVPIESYRVEREAVIARHKPLPDGTPKVPDVPPPLPAP